MNNTRFAWLLALFVGFVGMVLSNLSPSSDNVVRLFARVDLVFCAVFAVLPSTIRLSLRLQDVSSPARLAAATTAAAVAMAAWKTSSLRIDSGLATGDTWPWQVMVAWASMFAATLIVAACKPAAGSTASCQWGWDAAFLVLAIAIPAAYNHSVATGMHNDLRQAMQDQRIARACTLAARLRQLQPQRNIDQVPISKLHQELRAFEKQLWMQVQQPLGQSASTAEVGQRVGQWMQLDRYSDALQDLQPLLSGNSFQPIALDYQGLCYQRLGDAEASLAAYQASAEYWRQQHNAEQHRSTESLASALRGIGYAARQLNRRSLEEAAYKELVELFPSGTNHLLLAQCYLEHQKADLAHRHANQAKQQTAALNTQADKILSALSVEHFGCFHSLARDAAR